LRFFQEVTGGKYYDENEIVPTPDMVETSSLIGKIDIDFKFPKITDEARKELKKMLNKPKTAPVQSNTAAPATEPVTPAEPTNEKQGE